MTHFNITMPDSLAKIIKNLMKEQHFDNTSEFFRFILREHLSQTSAIEEILPDDPEYTRLEQIRKKSTFRPLKDSMK